MYLKYGIAFILFFIGVKLVLHAMHENTLPFVNGGEGIEWAPEIPTVVSLVVILASMLVATVASLIKMRADGTPVTGAEAAPASVETGDDERPGR
ncbi:putative tellurium resistance membrane protein TerC [Clavibacter sp. B3I6]|nr:putative tellurium resistance membrane protein TerC [Clavibacter sp. B3I6]